MISLTTSKAVINKTLLSIFCILSIGERYKKKQKMQLLPSESFQFIGKAKTNKGDIFKQMEDAINYEMYSPLRLLKFRRGEVETCRKSLFEEGALELGVGGWTIFGREGEILVVKLK